MTGSNQLEESYSEQAQRVADEMRAAISPERLAQLARIEAFDFERLVSFIFFDDQDLTLAALKDLVVDWSFCLALKEITLNWPQAPAPIRAKNVRAELYALRDGSDPQSPRDHAIRRLVDVIAPDLASEEPDGGRAVAAVDENQIRRTRRRHPYRRFEF
jgi:hypothetical protein